MTYKNTAIVVLTARADEMLLKRRFDIYLERNGALEVTQQVFSAASSVVHDWVEAYSNVCIPQQFTLSWRPPLTLIR